MSPISKTKTSSKQGIQVIARAAEILRTLEGHPEGLSLGVIAKQVGLARSTVQRIVGALVEERYLIAASPTGRVRLGPALVSLGSAAKTDMDKIIRPYLQKLSEEIKETVDLSILDKNQVIFVDQILDSSQRLQAVSQVGMAFPLYCSANGKAILSSIDIDDLDALLPSILKSYTKKTITTKKALKTELSKIQKEKVAFDREEHSEGVSAIGAAINDPYGRFLAISIPVPTVRFINKERKLAIALKKYVRLIEDALGCSKS